MSNNNREPLRDRNGLTEEEFLAAYHPGHYPHPSVTADILIFALGGEVKLLMIRRGGHPCLGMWALPGGFVNPDENTDSAASRELYEETSLTNVALNQLAVFSDPGRDKRCWIITCAYTALVGAGELKPQAADDADDTAWFDVTVERTGKKAASENGFENTVEDAVLTLKGAGETLSASLCISECALAYGVKRHIDIVSCDGIAFDHAKIIMTALCDERRRDAIGLWKAGAEL